MVAIATNNNQTQKTKRYSHYFRLRNRMLGRPMTLAALITDENFVPVARPALPSRRYLTGMHGS